MDGGGSGDAGDTTVRTRLRPCGVQTAEQGGGSAAELDAQRREREQAEEAAVEGGGRHCGSADVT